jgi:biotin carboxyl carrier protein
MKLKAKLFGIEHVLFIKREDGRVFAEIEGRKYELEIRERGGDEYLLLEDMKVYSCRVESFRDSFTVHLRQHSYPIRIIDPKRLRSSESAGRHDHGSAEIVAPMPGKVVRVLVAEGEPVTAGSGILVVEAMKMQNELKTPKTGLVVSIRAQPGATVNAGDVLAVVE